MKVVKRKFYHVSRNAIAKVFRFIADGIEAKEIIASSVEWEPSRRARFTIVYENDAKELEVEGVAEEDDEHDS